MPLLLALLVVAYIGSLWVSSKRVRAFGSPSGVEYVALGAVLGPHALGALGDEALRAFEPVSLVALGWISLGYGLQCGVVNDRRAPLGRLALGCVFSLIVAAVVAGNVVFMALHFGWLSGTSLLMLSCAVGLVSAESARHAARWVAERYAVQGPLSDLVEQVTSADDAPTLLGLAALFAFTDAPHALLGRALPSWAMALGTVGVGVLLGLVCAWLTARTASRVERWTVLLGCAWLATGFTTSLGLSAMAATFALGITVSAASPIAAELRANVRETEGAVLLPALLMSGAHLDLPTSSAELWLIGGAVLARSVASLVTGTSLGISRHAPRGATAWLGLGMLSSGTLTVIIGLALCLRFPGSLGRIAIAVAFAGTVLGELVGPFALKRALGQAGELGTTPVPEAPLSTLPEVAP